MYAIPQYVVITYARSLVLRSYFANSQKIHNSQLLKTTQIIPILHNVCRVRVYVHPKRNE